MIAPFLGTGIAIVTPFKSDLSIDHDALTSIVNYNINNGINYIVISGTTGESVTVSKAEKREVINTIKTANNGRLPLVLGIGGNNTQAVIDEINSTDLSEFSGILSVSPAYNKPTQEGLYQHFKSVSSASPVPVILYNVPGRTASNMLPETVIKLATDFDNIIAIKEAGNNVWQYLQLLRDKPKDFLVISGDDDLALGIVLAGGAGVISVIGQGFPKEFSTMINHGLKGENKAAYDIYYRLMEFIELIFAENNPAGIKAVLETLNLCQATVRLPLVEASKSLKNKIEQVLESV